MSQLSDTSPSSLDDPSVPLEQSDVRPERPIERRLLRILVPLMLLAIVAAVVINWRWGPQLIGIGAPGRMVVATKYTPRAAAPAKPPLQQLPSEILAYETITRQGVPGQAAFAAEAVYVTMNVNLEMQISTNVYARAQAYGSSAEAKAKQDDLMATYSNQPKNIVVGGTTLARTGFDAKQGAYVVSWVRDDYLTYVKSTFRDWTPNHLGYYLVNLANPVVNAVDVYQRTGKQGVQIGATKAATGTVTPSKPGTRSPESPIQKPGGLGF